MRSTYFIITLAICFCMSLHAENKANNYMKQAQSSLEQKDFTKARYLFSASLQSLLERRRLYTSHRLRNKSDVPVLSRKLLSGSIRALQANDAVSFNRRTESAKDLLRPTFPIDKRTVADVHKTQKRGTGTASTQHVG